MNLEAFKEIISEIEPISIILDKKGSVIWQSDQAKGKFSVKGQDLNLDLNLEKIKKNGQAKIRINNMNYLGKIKRISIEKEDYFFVYYENIGIMQNKDIRIEFLEAIIDKISDGIIASDFDGRVTIYNNAMEKLEDKRSKDFVGKFLWDAYGYTDESESEHRRIFHSGKPIINQYKAHAYKNGVPRYVQYSTYPFYKDGHKVGVYTISKNETKLHNLLSETVELKREFHNREKLNEELEYKKNGTRYTFTNIVGSSQQMTKVIKEAESIAWIDNNILIIGETGTGKEMFAQSIHNHGKKRDAPFIGVNCSAIPENLLESMLFGTVEGAFTGAVDSDGLFLEAGEGTLFLDELNSMPMNMQTKLLRVIQERRVMRVGGKETLPVKCRIVGAMNEDPGKIIEEGRLREDLFYRIGGFQLFIPPLKERRKDIFDLADFFIRKLNESMNKNVLGLSDELKKIMQNYLWPGNVRELNHFIENSMVMADEEDDYLQISHIPDYLSKKFDISHTPERLRNESLTDTLNRIEEKLIIETLNKNDWNVSQSAKDLGIIRQSLIYRIKKLNIQKQ